ncbi:CLH domain-containing protein [Trichodesmium erythraeum 21-75]|jgi:hypothetical protein|nr:CLH domain-containing protein [Trichodesmium erythraeum 21-75]
MALTKADERRIEQLLDELDDYQQERVLSSQQSFENWLYDQAYSIYCKVRNWLNDLWAWLFG